MTALLRINRQLYMKHIRWLEKLQKIYLVYTRKDEAWLYCYCVANTEQLVWRYFWHPTLSDEATAEPHLSVT